MEKAKINNIHTPPLFATPYSDKELARQVNEAQKGPFYTSEQVKQELKKWKNKRA